MDGRPNPKIQSIHLERFPIHKAQFSRDGESVVATGVKNKMFYMYDMMEGRVVPVFSVRGEEGFCVAVGGPMRTVVQLCINWQSMT